MLKFKQILHVRLVQDQMSPEQVMKMQNFDLHIRSVSTLGKGEMIIDLEGLTIGDKINLFRLEAALQQMPEVNSANAYFPTAETQPVH